jgi:hypothetical protein
MKRAILNREQQSVFVVPSPFLAKSPAIAASSQKILPVSL